MATALTKKRLLQALKDFAEELGETPSAYQMDKEGPHSTGPYYRRWDSWFEVLEDAGLEPTESSLAGHPVDDPYDICIYTNNDGHRELQTRAGGEKYNLMVHRLHATLLVEEIGELKGKIVHHANGCPFDNRLKNYQIVSKRDHRRVHATKYNKTLCRDCDQSVRVSQNVSFCPTCGRELAGSEKAPVEALDWRGSS